MSALPKRCPIWRIHLFTKSDLTNTRVGMRVGVCLLLSRFLEQKIKSTSLLCAARGRVQTGLIKMRRHSLSLSIALSHVLMFRNLSAARSAGRRKCRALLSERAGQQAIWEVVIG